MAAAGAHRCEIEDFAETHLCACVALRTRDVECVCPLEGYRSATLPSATVVMVDR